MHVIKDSDVLGHSDYRHIDARQKRERVLGEVS